MQPYYERNGIALYLGDCREVLSHLTPVDLVLTDPPYGIEKRERTYAIARGPVSDWDDNFPLWWLDDAARLAPVIAMMPGIINLPACPKTIGEHRYRWTLAVHISNGMTRSPVGYGNWIPCVVYAKDGVKLYRQQSDIGRVAVSGRKPNHPSPKPIAAMQWLINRLPGQVILDPFSGSGSTLIAAAKEGRRAIGVDSNEAYCEEAARRLSELQLPLAVNA